MPDLIVTPTVQSLTVGDAASITVGAATYEESVREAYRLFSDFPGNAAPWTTFTAASATATYTHSYSGSTINYVTVSPAIATSNSRGWVSDRPNLASQPQILAGNAAMSFSARIRFNRNSQTELTCRSGFTQAHVEPVLTDAKGDGQTNALCFYCAGSKTTWHVLACADYSELDETGNATDTDSGISVDDWHVLKVSVNAAGSQASFYIDGALVTTITGNSIPTSSTFPGDVSAGGWMMAGTVTRTTSTGISSAASFDVDWQLFEYEVAR